MLYAGVNDQNISIYASFILSAFLVKKISNITQIQNKYMFLFFYIIKL